MIAPSSKLPSLSRFQVFRFFRNFAVALFTLCGCYLQLNGDSAVRTQEQLMDSVALYVADHVSAFVRSKHGDGRRRPSGHVRVSFDDIAEWYSGGGSDSKSGSSFKYGHEVMSWLELLDLGKWVKLVGIAKASQ
jgi:hypothetical protein